MDEHVISVLTKFAEKKATSMDAMRALAEHAEWYLPAALLPGDPVVVDNMILFSSEGKTPERLWIFTSAERAHLAANKGYAMGAYGGPISGTIALTLFRKEFSAVDVNPGSPRAETWFMGNEAFPLARVWAEAVVLERALHGDVLTLVPKLHTYAEFLLLVAQDNTLVRLPLPPDDAPFALAFTAPDWRDAFLEQVSPSQRAGIKSIAMRGSDLFAQLEKLGAQGVIVNVTAPANLRSALPLEVARLVMKYSSAPR